MGKSTELYGWVQFQRKNKNVLYIHRNAEVGDFILVCTSVGINQYCLGRLQPDLNNSLRRLLLLLKQSVQFDIVVCDGYRKEDGMLHGVFGEFKNQIVIYCSSYRASIDIKGEAYHTLVLRHGDLVTFEMDSWKLQQYFDAWGRSVLDHNVFQSKSMIQHHYFYAGGNLRLMLMSEKQCIDVLRNAFSQVNDISATLQGLYGQSAITAVNTLFQRIDGGFRPVSEYVSRWLLQKFPNNSNFIAAAKNIMPSNPSYQGWILEYEALDLIINKRISLSPSFHPWNSHNGTVIFFDDVIDLENRGVLPNNTLLIPNTYNHALVDALFYFEQGHLCGLNITLAKKHIFKLHHILPYLKLYCLNDGKCKFDFHVIIPYDKRNTYKISRRHFNDKHKVAKFDNNWTSLKSAQELASVYLMDRSGRLTMEEANEIYQYGNEGTIQEELSGCMTRKRAREERNLEPDEDEEEVENELDPDICEVF